MFVAPGDQVFEGMIVGESARPGDMDVNVGKEKKLTQYAHHGPPHDHIMLEPPREITLEYALEYIEEDEIRPKVTPQNIRLRKRVLQANDRKERRSVRPTG